MKLEKIATAHSPFVDKFGIPKQPHLVATPGEIHFEKTYSNIDAFKELEEFERIILIFGFHGNRERQWSDSVFSTRSTYRPNPIGQSVVVLKDIKLLNDRIVLSIEGHDLLDGTPIYDIKPYVPEYDSFPDSKEALSEESESSASVVYINKSVNREYEVFGVDLVDLAARILTCDPRPAFQSGEHEYGMRLGQYNISFQFETDGFRITNVSEQFQ